MAHNHSWSQPSHRYRYSCASTHTRHLTPRPRTVPPKREHDDATRIGRCSPTTPPRAPSPSRLRDRHRHRVRSSCTASSSAVRHLPARTATQRTRGVSHRGRCALSYHSATVKVLPGQPTPRHVLLNRQWEVITWIVSIRHPRRSVKTIRSARAHYSRPVRSHGVSVYRICSITVKWRASFRSAAVLLCAHGWSRCPRPVSVLCAPASVSVRRGRAGLFVKVHSFSPLLMPFRQIRGRRVTGGPRAGPCKVVGPSGGTAYTRRCWFFGGVSSGRSLRHPEEVGWDKVLDAMSARISSGKQIRLTSMASCAG